MATIPIAQAVIARASDSFVLFMLFMPISLRLRVDGAANGLLILAEGRGREADRADRNGCRRECLLESDCQPHLNSLLVAVFYRRRPVDNV